MEESDYSFGAKESPKDIRTFGFAPTAVTANVKGGERYVPIYIEHQHKVGICTAISVVQNAHKATGMVYSADFQYLLQKREYDKDWDEGSSLLSSLKVAKNFGLLPATMFTYATENDRKLPYHKYIKKLQDIPDAEIERLKKIASQYKISAFASVPVTRNSLANAIDESDSGILVRFAVGKEWYTRPIEPLRPPVKVISGHAITMCNYNGDSFRLANTWGVLWADEGTAYHLLSQYKPTEAWIVYYEDIPTGIDEQLKKRESLMGRLLDLLQEFLNILQK